MQKPNKSRKQDEKQDQIQQQQLLGGGTFGKVYKVVQNGQVYAIKRINKLLNMHSMRDTQLQREIQTMKQIDHENIIKFYGFSSDPTNKFYQIKMQYCEGTNLNDFMLDPTKYCKLILPDPKKQKYFAIKICLNYLSAICQLRSKMIINRDIKPDNIMIKILQNGQIQVKMIDLGQARFLMNQACSFVGTYIYMAPEIRYNTSKYTDSCDLWSIGETFYQIFQGINPEFNKFNISTKNGKLFMSFPLKQNIQLITPQDYRNYYQQAIFQKIGINFTVSRTPAPFRHIIRQTSRVDPENRIKFKTLIQVLKDEFDQYSDCFLSQKQRERQRTKLTDCYVKQKQTQYRKEKIVENISRFRQIYESLYLQIVSNCKQEDYTKYPFAVILSKRIIQEMYLIIYGILQNMNIKSSSIKCNVQPVKTQIMSEKEYKKIGDKQKQRPETQEQNQRRTYRQQHNSQADEAFIIQQILHEIVTIQNYTNMKQKLKILLEQYKRLGIKQQSYRQLTAKLNQNQLPQNLSNFLLTKFNFKFMDIFNLIVKYFKQ